MTRGDRPDERSEARDWESRAVWLAFALCLAAAVGYTVRFASWVPWWDYWDLAEVIGGLRPLDLAWLLEPHQEHRIPLSKLGLVTLAWVIPDVRAASLLNVAGCAAFAVIALRAARRLRGETRLPDVVIPLLALHAGHYTTYLLGFQLQMVLSSLLVLSSFALLLEPTRVRLAAAALLLAVLPLSGLNGVLAAPPLAAWLAFQLLSPDRRSAAGVVLASVALACSLLLAIDSTRLLGGSELEPASRLYVGQALHAALQFVATSFGVPAARHAALVGLAFAATLFLCTPVLRSRSEQGEVERNQVLGIVALLGGGLALAIAIGFGRSDHGPGAGIQHRYAVMSLLIAYAVYLASIVAGRTSALARALQWGWLGVACIAIGAATLDGVRAGRHYEKTLEEAERKIPVLPDDILGDELQSLLHGGNPTLLARRIGALRTAGLLPPKQAPPPDQLARYRIALIQNLIAAERRAAAARQIETLAASGVRGARAEAERLRVHLAGAGPAAD